MLVLFYLVEKLTRNLWLQIGLDNSNDECMRNLAVAYVAMMIWNTDFSTTCSFSIALFCKK